MEASPRPDYDGHENPVEEVDVFKSADPSLNSYLKEIGQYPLLTAAQEVKTAKIMESGIEAENRLSKILESDQYEPDLILDLQEQIAKGHEAKKLMVNSNLRLVVSIAKYRQGKGLEFLDLIQEGTLGLIRAAEKFDWRRGYKFSTYATWWIRQHIERAIADKSSNIRVPVHITEHWRKIRNAKRDLNIELGRDATYDEIKSYVLNRGILSQSQWETAQSGTRARMMDSLNDTTEDDDEYGTFITDEYAVDPGKEAENIEALETVKSLLNELNDRERQLIVLRFGLADDEPKTLEEIGKQFEITRERVRQLINHTTKKLQILMKDRGYTSFTLIQDD